jgi:hypothetical protein
MKNVLKTQVIRKLKKLRKLSDLTPTKFRNFRIWGTPRARGTWASAEVDGSLPTPAATEAAGAAANPDRRCFNGPTAARATPGRPALGSVPTDPAGAYRPTPWPSRWPRAALLGVGGAKGRGVAPRRLGRTRPAGVADATSQAKEMEQQSCRSRADRPAAGR